MESEIGFKCNKCESTYSTSNMLRRHIRIKHENLEKSRLVDNSNKPISCVRCTYRTNTENALVVHMDKHTDLEYYCIEKDCSYSHKNLSRFQNHQTKNNHTKLTIARVE